MPQPSPYSRNYSFTDHSTNNPSTPQPGVNLDAEFNEIAGVTEDIIDRLALLQRDDGQLANDSVGYDQLSSTLSLGFRSVGDWATATGYVASDAVWVDSTKLYRCVVAHTSGTFATDLAAEKWVLVIDMAEHTGSSFAVDRFSGDGSDTTFTLSEEPQAAGAMIVHVGGVYQVPGVDYTVSGTTLTFTVAPASGTNNVVAVHAGAGATGTRLVLSVAGKTGAITLEQADITDLVADLAALVATDAANLLAAKKSVVRAISSADTIVAADLKKTLYLSGASSYTLAVTACATLGDGFEVEIVHDGTGVVTLDPNGAETVDGRSSIKIWPGERFKLWTNGTLLATKGRAKRLLVQTDTPTSGTAVNIETPFTDAEAVAIEVEIDGLTFASGTCAVQYKSGGAYVTTNYTNHIVHYDAGGSTTTTGGSIALHAGSVTSISGRLRITNLSGTAPLLESASTLSTGVMVVGSRSSVTIEGIRINPGTTISAGAIRTYLLRA